MKGIKILNQKQQLIIQSCPDLIKAAKVVNKYNNYKFKGYEISNYLGVAYKNAISIFDLYGNDVNLINECLKIAYNQKERYKRTRDKLQIMMSSIEQKKSGYLYFVTLTFNEDVLEHTKTLTRRKYVTRYLNQYSIAYIANIDFGLKNQREHYHAVILTEYQLDYEKMALEWQKILKQNEYIQISFENIAINDNSLKAIPKYLNKLTNHSYKDGTSQYAIYSKNFENSIAHFIKWDTILDTMPLPFDV